MFVFSHLNVKLDLFFSLRYFYGFKKIFREIKMSKHDLIKGFNLRNTLYKAEQVRIQKKVDNHVSITGVSVVMPC